MYERSAIILERFFNKLFGHDEKNNLKDNFLKYSNLVECSAKYSEATDSEDKIMQEYDEVANRIKNIQKNQEMLGKRSIKFQQERDAIFQNIAEESPKIKKLFDDIEKDIDENNEKIKQNEIEFINVISDFSEKSEVRDNLGKQRKKVESEYSNALNEALEVYKHIDKEKIQYAKSFSDKSVEIEKQLYEKMRKNGEKENVPFDNAVIKSAIKLEINIQKKEIDLLCNIYEKTNRLFSEIKNNSTKIDRHKKQIKDTKSKIEFLTALKEYLVQFLDNERLTAVNGESEHKRQMKDACKNFEDDLIQINNMYELLLKEISGKANKKMYKDLYNVEYLRNLEKSSEEFEKEISKLNLLGTVIDPNHWRIEGMKKIYSVFHKSVTENYGRNLSDFEITEKITDDENKIVKNKDLSETNNHRNISNQKEKHEEEDSDLTDKKDNHEEDDDYDNENDENLSEDDFDEKIDMILGFDRKDSKINKKSNDIVENSHQSITTSKNDKEQDDNELLMDDDFDDELDDDFEDEDEYDWDDDELDDDIWDDDDDDDNGFFDDYEEDDLDDKKKHENFEDDEFLDDYDEDDFEDEEVENEFSDDIDEDDGINEKNSRRTYEEDDPWTDDDNELYVKKVGGKNNIKTSENSIISEGKGKSVRNKHKKSEEKPRGLLGKFIK